VTVPHTSEPGNLGPEVLLELSLYTMKTNQRSILGPLLSPLIRYCC